MVQDLSVSVVIPTYNRAGFVQQAIDSALKQSVRPLEVIVVDDGSTDGTASMLRRAYRNDCVTVVAGEHRGAAAARNEGVRVARGELIAFLDSDDLFEPRKLACSCGVLKADPRLVFVHGCWVQHNLESGERQIVRTKMQGDARHELLMFGRIATPTVVVRRESFLSIGGFRESLHLVEDYDLWCRLSSLGPVGLLREPLSIVRLHGANTPRSAALVMRNQFKVIRYFFSHFDTDGLREKKFYLANSLYPVASLYIRDDSWKLALTYFLAAWSYDLKTSPRRATLAVLRAVRSVAKVLVSKAESVLRSRRLSNWLS